MELPYNNPEIVKQMKNTSPFPFGGLEQEFDMELGSTSPPMDLVQVPKRPTDITRDDSYDAKDIELDAQLLDIQSDASERSALIYNESARCGDPDSKVQMYDASNKYMNTSLAALKLRVDLKKSATKVTKNTTPSTIIQNNTTIEQAVVTTREELLSRHANNVLDT